MQVLYSFFIEVPKGEIEVVAKADVEFGSPAEIDERGFPTECATGDTCEILEMYCAAGDFPTFPMEALPKESLREIEGGCIEAARATEYSRRLARQEERYEYA